jgi:hypothetical protein
MKGIHFQKWKSTEGREKQAHTSVSGSLRTPSVPKKVIKWGFKEVK